METGKTIKIHRNVPAPIPIELPKKKSTSQENGKSKPIPVEIPQKVSS